MHTYLFFVFWSYFRQLGRYPRACASSFVLKQILFSSLILLATAHVARWYLFEFLLPTNRQFLALVLDPISSIWSFFCNESPWINGFSFSPSSGTLGREITSSVPCCTLPCINPASKQRAPTKSIPKSTKSRPLFSENHAQRDDIIRLAEEAKRECFLTILVDKIDSCDILPLQYIAIFLMCK